MPSADMPIDTLSDVLKAVRLQSALYFFVDASAPWAEEAPEACLVASRVHEGASDVIEYHVVMSGECHGGLVGGEPIHLETGDIIVFPQGDRHWMASDPHLRPALDPDLFARLRSQEVAIPEVSVGGTGTKTLLLCGFMACDATPHNPLLRALPRVLVVRAKASKNPTLAHFSEMALRESRQGDAGSSCVLARLSELMFIEAIREYVQSLGSERPGWLGGLRDQWVGSALSHLHQRPAFPWTIETLAKEVGMSRSVLADRFSELVGVPPMQYLTDWRMQLTATMLRNSSEGLARIAESVGYGSEAALSRAFKRSVGQSPAAYRAASHRRALA
ncbi:MAG TPA: AraC family transcriptional regulator [Polyangiaceae bacterium]|nr:AraC family transcriptional regulator [Polyangiaceae bacterium]